MSATAPSAPNPPPSLSYGSARLAARRESPWRIAGCLVLLLIAWWLIIEPSVRLSQWHVSPDLNPCFLEAQAWRHGTFELDQRVRYTALVDGRILNVYPPLFTFISRVAIAYGLLQGLPENVFYAPWLLGVVALPLPFVGFWAFRQVVRRSEWAAVLTGCWLVGTAMWPVMRDAHSGLLNPVHSLLSTTGLMLIAGDLMGRKRIWPAAIGLLICAWSRQMTLPYGAAILWVAWRHGPQPRRNVAVAGTVLVVIVGVLAGLNWAKFGNPLESGYRYIYAGGYETD